MPNDAPPDSLDEHRHFLTNVLNNLTNCEAYQKQRPMKVQSYTPLLSSMLSLLEKMRNQPTMDQLQATINQIKNTTEQTLTKVTYVERKQDTARTTPTTSSAATTVLEYSLSPISSSSALQAAMTAISSHLRSKINIMPSTVYLTGYESRVCALRHSDGILHA